MYTESLRVIKKIRATFLPQNVDTTAISEWWLKPSISSIDVSLVDYSTYKKNTLNKIRRLITVRLYISCNLQANMMILVTEL